MLKSVKIEILIKQGSKQTDQQQNAPIFSGGAFYFFTHHENGEQGRLKERKIGEKPRSK
jgi:hypothetical protein